MYRIRHQDGRELEFPSIQSFSDAVRAGTVGADDEIFHRRAERWLPVREHPHFQKALAEAPTPPAAAPPKPPADDVNLDAILALLDGPGLPAAPAVDPAASADPGMEAAPPEEPAAPESALESIDELPVLRAAFEQQEEPPAPSDEQDEPEPVETEVPIEALAPDDPEPDEWEPDASTGGWTPEAEATSDEPAGAPDEDAEDDEYSEEELFPTLETSAPEPEAAVEDSETALEEPEPTPAGEPALPWMRSPTEPEAEEPAPVQPPPLEPLAPTTGFSGPEMGLEPSAPPAAPEPPSRRAAEPEPIADGAAAAGLDWAATVSGTFPVERGRSRLPLVAAAVVLLTLAAFFLLRRGDRTEVASEGLRAVSTSTAAAAEPPSRQAAEPLRDSAETLVIPPDVPEGGAVPIRPPAQVQEATADSAREQVVPLSRPRMQAGGGTGGISVAPITVGTFSGMKSHADLMRFYNASYDQAQARLEADLVRAGFTRLFGAGTLTTSDGLRDGRRAIESGRAALTAYRAAERGIEAAYRDSLTAMGRRLGLGAEVLSAWAPRPSRLEPARAEAPISPLLQAADEALAFLQGEIGHYRLQGSTMVFEREAAAQRLSQYRQQLERAVEGLDQGLITQRAVARALGSPGLPLEMSN